MVTDHPDCVVPEEVVERALNKAREYGVNANAGDIVGILRWGLVGYTLHRSGEVVAVPRAVWDAVTDFADTDRATGWTETDGLKIGPPEAEHPAVLVERDLFNEFCRKVNGYRAMLSAAGERDDDTPTTA